MEKFVVQLNLEHVRDARAKFNEAAKQFGADVDEAMKRLIHESAAQMMSAQEVAKHSGFSTAQIKARMKALDLNPTKGKRLLSKHAAAVLASNAELMGVKPTEIDLMSPLAYLPAGNVSAFLETQVRPDIDESLAEDEPIQWHRSEVLMEALRVFGEGYATRELETELDVVAAIERVIAEAQS